MATLSNRIFYSNNRLKKIKYLFVMESPGKEELDADYACVGPTGMVMAKYLVDDDSESLGDLIKDSKNDEFAIFETFVFPLNQKLLDSYNDEFQRKMAQLKKIDRKAYVEKLNKEGHEKRLNDFWKNPEDLEIKKVFIKQYKKDLIDFINLLEEKCRIVICGFIAQSCFRVAFGLDKNYPYGCFFALNGSKVKRLFFSNHPSVELHDDSKKKVWKFGDDYKKTLK